MEPGGRDELAGIDECASLQCMLDRLVRRPVVPMPRRRATVKRGREPRLPILELDAEELREQMVKAVPRASIIEGPEKQIRMRERGQQLARAFLLEYGVAQRAAQPLENGAAKHERLRGGVVRFEDLGDEEVDHGAALGTERPHERPAVVDSLK